MESLEICLVQVSFPKSTNSVLKTYQETMRFLYRYPVVNKYYHQISAKQTCLISERVIIFPSSCQQSDIQTHMHHCTCKSPTSGTQLKVTVPLAGKEVQTQEATGSGQGLLSSWEANLEGGDKKEAKQRRHLETALPAGNWLYLIDK